MNERRQHKEKRYYLRSAKANENFVKHPDKADLIRDNRSGNERRVLGERRVNPMTVIEAITYKRRQQEERRDG